MPFVTLSISQNIEFPALPATLLMSSINVYIVCRDHQNGRKKMNKRKEDRSGGYASFPVALVLYDIALLFVSNGSTADQ
ncbi:hypothetical protein VNO80_25771 [Phaseolus coccineus]|uniref:Uncharacterized protein n=1 Tax=Phaseolus coccineus TaxID=3886 RepID=A0AAN9QM65_PHACN